MSGVHLQAACERCRCPFLYCVREHTHKSSYFHTVPAHMGQSTLQKTEALVHSVMVLARAQVGQPTVTVVVVQSDLAHV